MTSHSLTHDVAWATAKDIVEVFAGCLREEERHDAFVEVYVRVRAGLRKFEVRNDRLMQRLRPGAN